MAKEVGLKKGTWKGNVKNRIKNVLIIILIAVLSVPAGLYMIEVGAVERVRDMVSPSEPDGYR